MAGMRGCGQDISQEGQQICSATQTSRTELGRASWVDGDTGWLLEGSGWEQTPKQWLSQSTSVPSGAGVGDEERWEQRTHVSGSGSGPICSASGRIFWSPA